MELGKSKPWPDAMEILTGTRSVNSSAILDYFKPLHEWLVLENKRLGNPVGWDDAEINFSDLI